MKKKNGTVIKLAALTVGMALLFSGCSGNGSGGSGNPDSSGRKGARNEAEQAELSGDARQHIFRETVLSFDANDTKDFNQLTYDGTYVYTFGNNYNEELHYSNTVIGRFTLDGTKAGRMEGVELPYAEGEGDSVHSMFSYITGNQEDGGIFLVRHVYPLLKEQMTSDSNEAGDVADVDDTDTADETDPTDNAAVQDDPEAPEDEDDYFDPLDYDNMTVELMYLNADMEVVWSVDSKEMTEPVELLPASEEALSDEMMEDMDAPRTDRIDRMVLSKEGLAIKYENGALALYDKENGNYVRTLLPGASNYSDMDYYELWAGADGVLYYVSWDYDEKDGSGGYLARRIRLSGEGVEEKKIALPRHTYDFCGTGLGAYEFFENSEGNVYGFNIGDKEKTLLMDNLDSDMPFSYYNGFLWIDDETYLISYFDDTNHYPRAVFSVLTKVPPEEVKDKTILTLGCFGTPDLRRQIVTFNRTNEEYRIRLKDYSNAESGDEDYVDYDVAISRMNTDIISGEAPDMLVLSSQMPIQSYINKGVLLNLRPYLEADADHLLDDLLPNVIDALTVNGGIYQIGPSVNINTIVGPKSVFRGIDGNWTIDDFERIMEANGGDYPMLYLRMNRAEFFSTALSLCGDAFIDWEKQSCSYDSPAFIKLMETAAKFPLEMNDTYWSNEYDANYRTGKSLFSSLFIFTYDEYGRQKYGMFGDDIAFAGFPYDGAKNYSGFTMDLQMAVNAGTAYPDACYEFLRTMFDQEYQDSITFAYPLRISSLERMAQLATQDAFYLDENGKKVTYERTYWMNGDEIVLPNLSEQDVAELTAFIRSVNYLQYNDQKVIEIIDEEAEAFFSGQKSAEEVAAIIQNRVRIYVAENS